jgi:GGDEF domain-containing protein
MAKDRRRPGRPDRVSASLVPLLRTPETAEVPAPTSGAEDARLAALRQLNLLDTAPTEAFDRITRMASQLFGLPIAAVSLTDSDRQWFKSRVGVDHCSIPREKAPCAQVAESSQGLVIPDLLLDPCYRDSTLASTGVRFYAGAPLTTREGFCLGSMCVLGPEPRQASESEMASLHDLAAMVMAQIELQHAFGRVDPLSGLPNHNRFIEDLEDLAEDRPARERRFAVLVDVANPEQLGNAMRVMGPSFLNEIIQEAAAAIKSAIGPTRTAYHVAPTQFAFLSPPDVEEQIYVALLASTMTAPRPARAGLAPQQADRGVGTAPRTGDPDTRNPARRRCAGRACPWRRQHARPGGSLQARWAGLAGTAWRELSRGRARIIVPPPKHTPSKCRERTSR